MLVDITHSYLTVQVGPRRATIQGELCQLDVDRTGFVLYTDTMSMWDEPYHEMEITETDRMRIIHILTGALAQRGQTLLVE
jgi:hypothetical protein